MKITLLQTALAWENREQNISHFEKLISAVEETQLIVLPEMFTTGFTMDPEHQSEPAQGKTLEWLKNMAALKNAVITGSVSVADQGEYYNRLFWVEPSGVYKTYDKRHLFRMAKEDEQYTAGTKRLITSIGQWKFCPLVCYDLRFPVWSRNRFRKEGRAPAGSWQEFDRGEGSSQSGWDYDVLIYVANWPESRITHWKQLLIARAIENQCYVVGLNRVGKDGNGYAYSGASMVLNPRGEIISRIGENEAGIERVMLDRTYLDEYRKAFPVGLDADDFDLIF